ncbi:MAG: hypothetical protein ACHQ2Z_00960 [Elusimicrobiota bacterium]
MKEKLTILALFIGGAILVYEAGCGVLGGRPIPAPGPESARSASSAR